MSQKNGKISAAPIGFVSEHKTTHSHRREITCDPRPLLVERNGEAHTTYWQPSERFHAPVNFSRDCSKQMPAQQGDRS